MKINAVLLGVMILFTALFSGCGSEVEAPDKTLENVSQKAEVKTPEKEYGDLPEDIEWLTNNSDPVFASENAKKGAGDSR